MAGHGPTTDRSHDSRYNFLLALSQQLVSLLSSAVWIRTDWPVGEDHSPKNSVNLAPAASTTLVFTLRSWKPCWGGRGFPKHVSASDAPTQRKRKTLNRVINDHLKKSTIRQQAQIYVSPSVYSSSVILIHPSVARGTWGSQLTSCWKAA